MIRQQHQHSIEQQALLLPPISGKQLATSPTPTTTTNSKSPRSSNGEFGDHSRLPSLVEASSRADSNVGVESAVELEQQPMLMSQTRIMESRNSSVIGNAEFASTASNLQPQTEAEQKKLPGNHVTGFTARSSKDQPWDWMRPVKLAPKQQPDRSSQLKGVSLAADSRSPTSTLAAGKGSNPGQELSLNRTGSSAGFRFMNEDQQRRVKDWLNSQPRAELCETITEVSSSRLFSALALHTISTVAAMLEASGCSRSFLGTVELE